MAQLDPKKIRERMLAFRSRFRSGSGGPGMKIWKPRADADPLRFAVNRFYALVAGANLGFCFPTGLHRDLPNGKGGLTSRICADLTHNTFCAVCAWLAELVTSGSPKDAELAEACKPRDSYLIQGIDLDAPEEGVQLWYASSGITEDIDPLAAEFLEETGHEITDPFKGAGVQFKRRGSTKHDTRYRMFKLLPGGLVPVLGSKEAVTELVGDLKDLSALFPAPNQESICQMLGLDYGSIEVAPASPPSRKPAARAAPAPAPAEDGDEDARPAAPPPRRATAPTTKITRHGPESDEEPDDDEDPGENGEDEAEELGVQANTPSSRADEVAALTAKLQARLRGAIKGARK